MLSGTFTEGLLDVFYLGDPAVVDGHHLVTRIDVIPERLALEVRGHDDLALTGTQAHAQPAVVFLPAFLGLQFKPEGGQHGRDGRRSSRRHQFIEHATKPAAAFG